MIRVSEKSGKYNEDLHDSAKLHQHLFHCLTSTFGKEKNFDGTDRVKNSSIAFTETVENLLNLLRFACFSQ